MLFVQPDSVKCHPTLKHTYARLYNCQSLSMDALPIQKYANVRPLYWKIKLCYLH